MIDFDECVSKCQDLINLFIVSQKLINNHIHLEINEYDSTIYDSYNKDIPLCYSFIIRSEYINSKISINPTFNEIIFQIKEINFINKLYFKEMYEKYMEKYSNNNYINSMAFVDIDMNSYYTVIYINSYYGIEVLNSYIYNYFRNDSMKL